MAQAQESILLIDPYDDERGYLAEGVLQPYNFTVMHTSDGSEGFQWAMQYRPDVIILDLNPEGMLAHDFMAAMSSQSLDMPVIIIADQGEESNALGAFRLGAKDYVVRPFRETELLQVVERAMREGRIKREREGLMNEVREAHAETEGRNRQLQTLMGIGKVVTAARRLDDVFDRVTRAAIHMTQAESVGFYLKDDNSAALILRAGQNLSRNLADKIGQVVDDQLANLTMSAQETFIGTGEGLRQFRPAQEGAYSVIYSPLVVQERPVGLLWVANSRVEFPLYLKDIMGALADYAAIAVVNARLFTVMYQRSQQLEAANKQLQMLSGSDVDPASMRQIGQQVSARIRNPLTHLLGTMNLFRTGEMGELATTQQAAVDVMHRTITGIVHALDEMVPPDSPA